MTQPTQTSGGYKRPPMKSALPLVGGIIGLSALVAVNLYLAPAEAMIVVAIIGLVAASATWVQSGGPEATPAGVLSVAVGVFGYFPTLYYSSIGSDHPMLPTATNYLLAVHMTTMALMTFAPPWPRDPMWRKLGIARCQGRWLFGYGLVLLAVGALITIQFGLPSTALPAAVGFVGVILMVYATIFTSHSLRKRSIVVAAVCVAIYMTLLFSSGGRLVIAGLVFTIALFLSQRVRRRGLKILVLASLVPALLLAARQRSEVIQATRGVNETGLESVVWPMDRLAILLQISDSGGLPPSWGDTFVPAILFWIPRRLWPEKPVGFGSELVPVVRPGYKGDEGHSEAATVLGEWVWNFGIAGLIVLPIVTVLLLAALTKWRQSLVTETPTPTSIISHLALALIAAGMLDLFWVGAFGFSGRTGMRLIALVIFAVLSALLPGVRSLQPGPGPEKHKLRRSEAKRNSPTARPDLSYLGN